MALIKCKECGKEISDKAPSCVNCGVPILEPITNKDIEITDKGKIKIVRPKKTYGWAVAIEVYFNDNLITKINNGKEIKLNANVDGILVFKTGNIETKVEVKSNQNYEILIPFTLQAKVKVDGEDYNNSKEIGNLHKKKRKTMLWGAMIGLGVPIVAIAVFILFMANKPSNSNSNSYDKLCFLHNENITSLEVSCDKKAFLEGEVERLVLEHIDSVGILNASDITPYEWSYSESTGCYKVKVRFYGSAGYGPTQFGKTIECLR